MASVYRSAPAGTINQPQTEMPRLLDRLRFPDLINDNAELVGSSFVLPDAALCDVPAELRSDR